MPNTRRRSQRTTRPTVIKSVNKHIGSQYIFYIPHPIQRRRSGKGNIFLSSSLKCSNRVFAQDSSYEGAENNNLQGNDLYLNYGKLVFYDPVTVGYCLLAMSMTISEQHNSGNEITVEKIDFEKIRPPNFSIPLSEFGYLLTGIVPENGRIKRPAQSKIIYISICIL